MNSFGPSPGGMLLTIILVFFFPIWIIYKIVDFFSRDKMHKDYWAWRRQVQQYQYAQAQRARQERYNQYLYRQEFLRREYAEWLKGDRRTAPPFRG